MRGLSEATRYHEGLKRVSLTRYSRPPRPEPHAQPVPDLVGPDPAELAPLDVDLADAFHPRAQLLHAADQLRLDAEEVAALFHHRHRGDLFHLERQRVVRHAGERKAAALAERDRGDVALVHFH